MSPGPTPPSGRQKDPDRIALAIWLAENELKPALKLEHLPPRRHQAVVKSVQAANLAFESWQEPTGLHTVLASLNPDTVHALSHWSKMEWAGHSGQLPSVESARLLGYPACCVASFQDYRLLDDARQFPLRPYWKTLGVFEPALNLVHDAGVLFHQPCSYDCKPSLQWATKALNHLPDGQERLQALAQPLMVERQQKFHPAPSPLMTGHPLRPSLLLPFGQQSPVHRLPKVGLAVMAVDQPAWLAEPLAPWISSDLLLLGIDAFVFRLKKEEDLAPLLKTFHDFQLTLCLALGQWPQESLEPFKHQGFGLLHFPVKPDRAAILSSVVAWAYGQPPPALSKPTALSEPLRDDRVFALPRQTPEFCAVLKTAPPSPAAQTAWILNRGVGPGVIGLNEPLWKHLPAVAAKVAASKAPRRAIWLSGAAHALLKIEQELIQALSLAMDHAFQIRMASLNISGPKDEAALNLIKKISHLQKGALSLESPDHFFSFSKTDSKLSDFANCLPLVKHPVFPLLFPGFLQRNLGETPKDPQARLVFEILKHYDGTPPRHWATLIADAMAHALRKGAQETFHLSPLIARDMPTKKAPHQQEDGSQRRGGR